MGCRPHDEDERLQTFDLVRRVLSSGFFPSTVVTKSEHNRKFANSTLTSVRFCSLQNCLGTDIANCKSCQVSGRVHNCPLCDRHRYRYLAQQQLEGGGAQLQDITFLPRMDSELFDTKLFRHGDLN